MMNHVVTLPEAPVNPGLWLPQNGSTTLFYYHQVDESATCKCFHCEHKSSLILPTWL